jgi:hypothetical protein
MNAAILAALDALRVERARFDAAITALEGLIAAPTAAAAPLALAPRAATRRATAPKKAAPAPTRRDAPGKYDLDVRLALESAGAGGTRCAQIAKRIRPDAPSEDIQRLTVAVYGTLQRFERDGIAVREGVFWKRAEVAA